MPIIRQLSTPHKQEKLKYSKTFIVTNPTPIITITPTVPVIDSLHKKTKKSIKVRLKNNKKHFNTF